MEWWHAIILGLVEGITEYLPISSTGHLIIASDLMGLGEAVNTYNIVIQGGAILAVAGLYWARVKSMLAGLVGRDTIGRRLFVNLVIAFLPAAILGPLLDDTIDAYLFSTWPVLGALALGGAVMIALTPWQRRHFDGGDGSKYVELDALTWKHALIVGLLQCVAMWPGTSRSMMTIVGGMLIGLRPKQAAEFSFLLGLPTLGGACAFKIFKDFRSETPELMSLGPVAVVIGLVVATLSAAVAIKWLVGYLQKHGVAVFGWYRIGLALVLGAMIMADWVEIG